MNITKQCNNCQKTFQISGQDQEYYNNLDFPNPSHCPDCRCQRRMATRNEKNFYPDKCDLCNKSLISLYSPNKDLKIYCHDCWWSDKWDATEQGIDYNPKKSFFEQFKQLQQLVPRPNVMKAGGNIINSDYCSYIGDAKNCYLVYGSIYVEDCFYGNPYYSKSCVDSLLIRECELCYECITSEHLYNCDYCQDCFDSNNLQFCYDCRGCTECIGCAGLRNQEYYIFNKKYSEEEYKKEKARINLCNPESFARVLNNFDKQKLKHPRKYMMGVKNENVTGNYINESKNARYCFDVKRAENSKYLAQTIDLKDCYDNNYTENNELCNDYIGSWKNNHTCFSNTCYQCNDVLYSELCYSCHDLVGCVGLRNKDHCIFNKPYSKSDYKKIKESIIKEMKTREEWGEFFPIEKSIVAYNESVANEYFPLKDEDIKERGFSFKEKEERDYKAQKYRVPQNIEKVPDSIIDEVLACKDCGKNYKVIKPELEFYQNKKLPIPKQCPDCRHKKRMNMRLPRSLWQQQCMCTQNNHDHQGRCANEFETSYSPDGKELVYCEECYNKEIY
ncbi:zinc-ribbon domain-containing protein [Patescibacteria group bacterium]|nr:zinc-ribbon domain-containing protein [Patescibacteria group bacterium]MBU1673119.1 zinc-ribbon domain-containing protein [Patescibacteria group bacterium]MBU1963797.1 zinc-ribbon domain-containing protein [Patescibacteria group bacterium]